MSLQELDAEAFRLYGRMAIVTGAATGIGRAIAHKFATHGASVCLLDIDRTQAETVAAEITRAGGTASAYECDVFDLNDFQSALIQVAFFGGYCLAALPAGRLLEMRRCGRKIL